MANPTIPVTASLSPELEKRARLAAASLGVSRAELIRLAIEYYLNQNPKPSLSK